MVTTVRTSAQARPVSGQTVLIALFLLSLVMPFFFFVGGLRLSAYRIVLLIMFLPAVVFWVSGRAGKIRTIDFLVLLIAIWPPIALLFNHGLADTWEFSGIYAIEALTPYLLARVLIRDMASFRAFVWFLAIIVAALLPFSIIESMTGRAILLEAFDKVFDVYRVTDKDPRLGLRRAQASLPHPILFGLFCSPVFALALYTLRSKSGRHARWRYQIVTLGAVFTSLSSGAFMSIAVQALLVGWDYIFRAVKKRWVYFILLSGAAYLALEIVSDRPVYQIAATRLTFDVQNSWTRVLIFRHTSDDIMSNPIFGLGFEQWSRPAWMKPSVDNFWLLQALSYGFPALFAYGATITMLFVQVARAQHDGLVSLARRGYLIAVFGVCFAVITVHMWDALYCLFMFLLGAGVWFLDENETTEESDEPTTQQLDPRVSRYTRFPAPEAVGSAFRRSSEQRE